jgi:single-strand DNA-binding protein
MNSVSLIGRLVREPELKTGDMSVCKFTIAIDRPVRAGQEKQADFPRIVCFGKTAENCEKYLSKGKQVAVEGRIQTGSYKDKEGKQVYTTDVIANRVEFLGSKDTGVKPDAQQQQSMTNMAAEMPASFQEIDEDVPF